MLRPTEPSKQRPPAPPLFNDLEDLKSCNGQSALSGSRSRCRDEEEDPAGLIALPCMHGEAGLGQETCCCSRIPKFQIPVVVIRTYHRGIVFPVGQEITTWRFSLLTTHSEQLIGQKLEIDQPKISLRNYYATVLVSRQSVVLVANQET